MNETRTQRVIRELQEYADSSYVFWYEDFWGERMLEQCIQAKSLDAAVKELQNWGRILHCQLPINER